MKVLETAKEVFDLLNQRDLEVLLLLADSIIIDMSNHVEQYLYNAYSPMYYHRTGEFLNAVRGSKIRMLGATNSRRMGFRIEIDTSYLTTIMVTQGKWNIHADIYGNDIRTSLPVWLMDGTTGGLFPRKGLGFREKLENALMKEGFTSFFITDIKTGGYGFIVNIA